MTAVHVEGAGAVGDDIPVGEDRNGRSGELGENLARDRFFHGRRERKLDVLPEKGGDPADIVPHTTH